jgi:hypothetical protein
MMWGSFLRLYMKKSIFLAVKGEYVQYLRLKENAYHKTIVLHTTSLALKWTNTCCTHHVVLNLSWKSMHSGGTLVSQVGFE